MSIQKSGYDYEIIGEVMPDLYCVVCLNLMRDAIQLSCDHGMCNYCLQLHERSCSQRGVPFDCPTCRQAINKTKIHPAKMVNRMVSSLRVKCIKNTNGCVWEGEISSVEDHASRFCDYEIVKCGGECEEEFERRCTKIHKELCEFRLVPCQYCGIDVTFIRTAEHLNQCEQYPVLCTLSECKMIIPRKNLEQHTKTCDFLFINCPYQNIGCMFETSKKEMNVHLQNGVCHHLSLSVAKVDETNKEWDEKLKLVMTKLHQTNEELSHLKEKMENLQCDPELLPNTLVVKKVIENAKFILLERIKNETMDFRSKLLNLKCGTVSNRKYFEECNELILPFIANRSWESRYSLVSISEEFVKPFGDFLKSESSLHNNVEIQVQKEIKRYIDHTYSSVVERFYDRWILIFENAVQQHADWRVARDGQSAIVIGKVPWKRGVVTFDHILHPSVALNNYLNPRQQTADNCAFQYQFGNYNLLFQNTPAGLTLSHNDRGGNSSGYRSQCTIQLIDLSSGLARGCYGVMECISCEIFDSWYVYFLLDGPKLNSVCFGSRTFITS